jgi:capsular polysaccharide export protein
MRPRAWVVYKPHPDVVAGLRRAGCGEDWVADGCDEVVTKVPIGSMLCTVDEVHVMTSLAGFEGLLRGCRVVCHGIPFYAGWGLTQDLVGTPRRQVQRTLEELVAAALIWYPRYVSLRSGKSIEVEDAVEELVVWRAHERLASRSLTNRLVRGLELRLLGFLYRLL